MASPAWAGARGLLALDCAAAGLLTALFTILALTESSSALPWPARVGLVALMGLPVALRRRWPLPVLAAVTAASVAAALLGVVHEPFLAVALPLYTVAASTPGSRWAPTPTIGLGSALVLIGGLLLGAPGAGEGIALSVLGIAVAGMAWTAGRAVHERRAYAERALRQATAGAVADERLRIARELHDIVAHHIGVIAVKAAVANHVLPSRPGEAAAALGDIEHAGRAALAELRHMLGVLRSEEDTPSLHPTVGLAGLGELAERARAAGVAVELRAEDLALPEGMDRSAYRIVQEALTNTIKHAAPTSARVSVARAGAALRIEITDDGAPRPSGPPGHGLLGMRERVAIYGGELAAGPTPGGGYRVAVELPLAEGAA